MSTETPPGPAGTSRRFTFDAASAESYRRGRALSEETLAVWTGVFREAVHGLTVRRALDVGAGTGRFSGILADAVAAPIVAFDVSLAMLAQREPGVDARFVAARAEALPVRGAAADIALLSMVYHHLEEFFAALAELRRVVRPGGCVLVRPRRQRHSSRSSGRASSRKCWRWTAPACRRARR